MCFLKRNSIILPAVVLWSLMWACAVGPQNKHLPVAGGVDDETRPWVFWYWMQASVSREGITADLEAMKAAGIGGAYLMPIKGAAHPPLVDPPLSQLTPEWWAMVRHAFSEADRLGLKLGMHASDGFAVAGGPWITPEQSMQKLVWTETHLVGGQTVETVLPQPETKEDYYRDIAVFAFPSRPGAGTSSYTVVPKVTTSKDGVDASYLAIKNNKENFRSDEPCWIQYSFDKPFTCRSVVIHTNGNNYQAHRLIIETSNDGNTFQQIGRLVPPRHGWQDTDADVTHAIPPTTARFFRFRYDQKGSEPGAEDLDAAKWKATLKICGIELSATPRLHQYEGKTGAVWRVSPRTTSQQIADIVCVPKDSIVDLTQHLTANTLRWQAPSGSWTILRIGHTSTGHTNYTGGAGKGLECDKFNPEAVTQQFNHWFGEAIRQTGPELAGRVLKVFHVDSWECGSQNWSPVFREAFRKRRGYDLMPYLPVMAGIPVEGVDVSERVLYDVRQTITELVHDNFYGTLAKLAHAQGCTFTAENVSPTMTSDGMLHFNAVDVPMGEFWWRSPTHDKPNDMLDAVSAAHIYGKSLIQAEGFTTLRMTWDEHPGMLKALGDRHYALGVNRLVYHVFTHNPWTNRKPGMTLDGVGLYFQRDQTWWKPGRAWIAYAQRCQAYLQQGRPVVDVAVFTGEEIPRRSVLPDRLVTSLPGIFGKEVVAREAKRLANIDEPLAELPAGVRYSANMVNPQEWIDPLNGYAFDSFNSDALLRLAQVRNGIVELPGGARYSLLIIPNAHPLSPDQRLMSPEVAVRLRDLVKQGATILIHEPPHQSPGLTGYPLSDEIVKQVGAELWDGKFDAVANNVVMKSLGKGRVVKGPYRANTFDALGLARDVIINNSFGKRAEGIAWAHRQTATREIYFLSNQYNSTQTLEASLRGEGGVVQLYDPLTDETLPVTRLNTAGGRVLVPVTLAAYGSVFIILDRAAQYINSPLHTLAEDATAKHPLAGGWTVSFDSAYGGPKEPVRIDTLFDWSRHNLFGIRHYSGTAQYMKKFYWEDTSGGKSRVWLDLGYVANLAEVSVNGVACGVTWTPPYRVDITQALKKGENTLNVAVTNTWANRLIGDHALPAGERITYTTAPFRLEGTPLREAGLIGPVHIVTQILQE